VAGSRTRRPRSASRSPADRGSAAAGGREGERPGGGRDPDLTRPLPSDRLLPWLFEELAHVPAERFVIVNDRLAPRVRPRREEVSGFDGRARLARTLTGRNHTPRFATMRRWEVARRRSGVPDASTSRPIGASSRLVEPHFMAASREEFKGIFPAVADIGVIMRYPTAKTIGDRGAPGAFSRGIRPGVIRHNGCCFSRLLRHVTLNGGQIPASVLGDPIAAHEAGVFLLKEPAMGGLPASVPVRGDDELRVSARPEPLPRPVQGDCGGAQIGGGGWLHRHRGPSATTASRSRQLQELLFDHARPAPCWTRSRPGLLPLRPVGGPAPRAQFD